MFPLSVELRMKHQDAFVAEIPDRNVKDMLGIKMKTIPDLKDSWGVPLSSVGNMHGFA